MAATGQAGTHAPQSIHSSGWMYSIVEVANSGSSFRGWMQSTGQTSTHAASLVPMHGSVITKAMERQLTQKRGGLKMGCLRRWTSARLADAEVAATVGNESGAATRRA